MMVGRDELLERFDVLLARLGAGRAEQSMVITGLRGVGKTVLLNEFRARSEAMGWAVIELEVSKHDDQTFRAKLGREARRALLTVAPKNRWREKAKRAAATLRSFSLTVSAEGSISAGLGVEPLEGSADSGMLDADLSDLMVALGEAAADHGTGVVLLLDELQFLSSGQLEAVIAGLHRCVQRGLPVTLVGAALPHIPELAGDAKSYSERLFRFPRIGRLSPEDAARALEAPAAERGVRFATDAINIVLEHTDGYPFFIQEFGRALWDLAPGPEVTASDAESAQRVVEAELDESFFRVRLDRASHFERAYLRAMAELGPDPHATGEVAKMLGRTSQQCAATRSRLIDKGLLYAPEFGYAAFTVPKFDEFLTRAVDADLPSPRRN